MKYYNILKTITIFYRQYILIEIFSTTCKESLSSMIKFPIMAPTTLTYTLRYAHHKQKYLDQYKITD